MGALLHASNRFSGFSTVAPTARFRTLSAVEYTIPPSGLINIPLQRLPLPTSSGDLNQETCCAPGKPPLGGGLFIAEPPSKALLFVVSAARQYDLRFVWSRRAAPLKKHKKPARGASTM
jgi:hypothetical protein